MTYLSLVFFFPLAAKLLYDVEKTPRCVHSCSTGGSLVVKDEELGTFSWEALMMSLNSFNPPAEAENPSGRFRNVQLTEIFQTSRVIYVLRLSRSPASSSDVFMFYSSLVFLQTNPRCDSAIPQIPLPISSGGVEFFPPTVLQCPDRVWPWWIDGTFFMAEACHFYWPLASKCSVFREHGQPQIPPDRHVAQDGVDPHCTAHTHLLHNNL